MNSEKYKYKPYNPIYPSLFKNEEIRIRKILGSKITIEHIGSSAIPNLGGKGIIDIYIIANKLKIKKISELLEHKLDYVFHQDNGDTERLFFTYSKKDNEGKEEIYHVHLSNNENPDFFQKTIFRDYLKSNSNMAKKYDDIKKQASSKAMQFKDYEKQKYTYQKLKAKIIEKINKKADIWHKNVIKKSNID